MIVTSADPGAVLPPGYTFTTADNGRPTFTFPFTSPGTQFLEVAEPLNPTIRGSRVVQVAGTAQGGFSEGDSLTPFRLG